ncbi:MAG: hypothetical protein WCK49_00240 [Myxococcaceae bacterium]
MKRIAGLLILLTGCNNINQTEIKSKTYLEEVVTKSLEGFAANSSVCREEKVALVRKDKALIQNLVAQVKNLANSSPIATLNIKSFSQYLDQSTADQIDMMFQILTSDGFRVVVGQTADLLRTVSTNDAILDNLTSVRDDLLSEPGDRISEIITSLASDRAKQDALLGAVKSATCNNPSETDLVGLLFTPQVLWELGANGTYLIASPLAQHARPLLLAVQQLAIPDELAQFVAMVKDMLPKQDICLIDNLDAYQPHIALALSLFKASDTANEPRPLRSLVNVLFKLYTMEDSNQCSGTSFDDLTKQSIQDALTTTANFLSDEQHGVVGVLKKMKPRK